MKKVWKVLWPWMLDVAVMVLAGWLMLGCSTKRLVQSNSRAVHDTVYVQHGVRDSVRWQTMLRDSVRVVQHDSIVLVRDTAGKVVARYEWHYGDRASERNIGSDKTRIKTDTLVVYRNQTDTETVVKQVTEPTKKHERRLAFVLVVLMLIVAAGALWKLRSVK